MCMNSIGYEWQPVPRHEQTNGARLRDKADEGRPQRHWSQAQCILVSHMFLIIFSQSCKSNSSSFGRCASDQGMFTFEKARVEPLRGSRSRVANNHGRMIDEEEFYPISSLICASSCAGQLTRDESGHNKATAPAVR